MVSRLAVRLALPVAATCAAAVLGLQALEVERLALVGAPWFDDENNELGAADFRSQGFDVVFSRSAALEQDPEPAAVCEWMREGSRTTQRRSSSEETASVRRVRSRRWSTRSAALC